MSDLPSNDPALSFGVLGPVMVRYGAMEIRIGTVKHRETLAVLLLHANERVERARIIDLVWDTAPPKSALNLVQKYAGELRRAFGPADRTLRLVPGGYQLDVAANRLDSTVFRHLLAEARRAHDDPVVAERCLRDALALWRGPAFDGMDTDAFTSERAQLEELRITAAEDLAEILLARGDHDAAAAELARWALAHPFRERLCELHMVALYRQGRRAEALAMFAAVRALLADELGIDPGPRLHRCYERILRDDPELAGVESGPTPMEAMMPVRQLPLDVPDFVGRSESLAELAALVHPSGPQLVVIVGSPGVGKTSLLVHAAHLASPAFLDGQLYFDLAGTSDEPRDPAQMLAEALRSLHVVGQAIPDSLAERAALYRSLLADRRMLVVLDDAGCAGQVVPLLPAATGCAVLIASRTVLPQLGGAHHLDLDVLTPDEARELFTGIVGVQRAAVEPAETEAILASCGNLPLAIRIAGAKLASRPAWSLRVLRERLADHSRRLAELRVGDLGVRASVELSVRMLPDDAARTLRLLGLAGPHTLPGWVVGPLMDRPEAEDVLDALVDASLVRVTDTDNVGQPRYRLHDLIRAYAVESAATIPLPDQRAAIVRVLAAWLALAERAALRLPAGLFTVPPGTAPRLPLPDHLADRIVADPFGWFDAERENLLGAVKLAVDWQLDELAWELAASAVTYYDHRCLYQDWELGHGLALNLVRAAGNRRGESVLLRGLGQIHIYRDRFTDATRALESSRQLCQQGGDKLGEALSIAMRGTINRVQERYQDARDHVEHALVIVVAEGQRHLEAQLRGSMAVMLLAQDHVDEAAQWFDAALGLARGLGDQHRVAVLLRGQSRLYDRQDEPNQALECLRQALRTFDDLADDRCAAYTLLEIGRVHAARHDRSQALPVLRHAAQVFHRHGDRHDEAECWQLLGDLDIAVGAYDTARSHLSHALRIWRAIGDVAQTAAATKALTRSLAKLPSAYRSWP